MTSKRLTFPGAFTASAAFIAHRLQAANACFEALNVLSLCKELTRPTCNSKSASFLHSSPYNSGGVFSPFLRRKRAKTVGATEFSNRLTENSNRLTEFSVGRLVLSVAIFGFLCFGSRIFGVGSVDMLRLKISISIAFWGRKSAFQDVFKLIYTFGKYDSVHS